jgi:hypothetical protein
MVDKYFLFFWLLLANWCTYKGDFSYAVAQSITRYCILFILVGCSLGSALLLPKLVFRKLLFGMSISFSKQPLGLSGYVTGLPGYLGALWSLAYFSHGVFQVFLYFWGGQIAIADSLRLWMLLISGLVGLIPAIIVISQGSSDSRMGT